MYSCAATLLRIVRMWDRASDDHIWFVCILYIYIYIVMCSQSGICVRVASASDLATQWLAHCIAIGIDDAISPNMRQTEWLCCCVIYIYICDEGRPVFHCVRSRRIDCCVRVCVKLSSNLISKGERRISADIWFFWWRFRRRTKKSRQMWERKSVQRAANEMY